jgi:hypothetical protein
VSSSSLVFCVNGRGRGRSPWALGGRRGRRTGIRLPAIVLENILCWLDGICPGLGMLKLSDLTNGDDDVELASTPHFAVLLSA